MRKKKVSEHEKGSDGEPRGEKILNFFVDRH